TGDIDRGECALVEQKTMHTCPVTEGWRSPFKAVQPHDVAVAVDASACRGRRTGDINRGEMALAQEKPVLVTIVGAHDVASSVDAKGTGVGSPRNINRGETLFFCQTTADQAQGKQHGKANRNSFHEHDGVLSVAEVSAGCLWRARALDPARLPPGMS